MRRKARRHKTPKLLLRTCVACRTKKPVELLVRYGASPGNLVQRSIRGGRGAWICQAEDRSHDARVTRGLQRALRLVAPAAGQLDRPISRLSE
ncbi:MAG: DUF448 domain-containing protein [Chloroflexi bacterium]|nr:DUF448 domain-containing protein [Chloroflexota bacterium]